MKIRVKDLLDKPTAIEVTGNEEWLSTLYGSFVVSDAAGVAKQPGPLRASLSLTKDVAGFVRVAGSVTFNPFLDCSRCSENIPWSIAEEIDVVFRPSTGEPQGGREINLSKDDLDQYVIQDGAIDLEELLNDIVQMAIPINTVQLNENGTACAICGLAVDEDRVYSGGGSAAGKGEAVKESPFAILKNLKS